MKIKVFADTICGWCYIGHSRLNKALDKYIEISTHLINMEDVVAARKLLLSIGFTKNSVEKFIKIAKDNAEMQVSEDFKLMLKGKVSKKYLN